MSKSKKKKQQSIPIKKEKKTSRFNLEFILSAKYAALAIAGIYLVVVGLISFIFHKVGDYGIETDFFWGYVPSAKKFLSGEIPMDAFRGPLYPMVLGIFGFVLGDFFHAGILIAVVSASVVIYVTYEMLKKIFSTKISFFVVVLLAINPIFIQYSYSAGTDMFFNALAALTLYFFFKNKEFKYKNLVLAAFIGGLSYLTRYNGVFLASFVIVILFVNYWNIDWLKRIKASLLFVAVFVITFSPWGFHCLNEKGSFFYNENYKNIAYEIYGKGKISWDDYWFKESSKITSFSEVIFKDIGSFTSTIFKNVGEHFENDMDTLLGNYKDNLIGNEKDKVIAWYLGIFVVLGLLLLLISSPWEEWKSRIMGYYLVNLSFFVLLLLVFYSERFSLFLIPFYLSLAIRPLFDIKLKLAKFFPLWLKYVLLAVLIIFTFVKAQKFNSDNINSGPIELLTLRDWYEENIPEKQKGKFVAARKAHVAYYLDMEFKLMPMAENYEEFITKLREENVDYLYFGIAEAGLRREFQYLIDPKGNHPGLDVVVYFQNPPSVLYRVLK